MQSVEALCQEIEDVRKELFGSPALKRRQEFSTIGDSPTSQCSKRQKIVSSTKEAKETRLPEHRETVKTYGELFRPLHNPIDVCDHFSDLRKSGNCESSFDSIFDSSTLTEGDKWGLPYSVRNELFFAKASSTIPDNTLDQQHMIDEILAENYPIPASAIQVNSESISSIPWSTNITSQNRKSQASSEPCDFVRDLAQDMTMKSAETDCDSNSYSKVTFYTPKGSPAQESFLDRLAANAKSHQTFLRSEERKPKNDIVFQGNCHESLESGTRTSASLTSSHNNVGHEREKDFHPRCTGRGARNGSGQAIENDAQETDREQTPKNIGALDHAMKVSTSSEPKMKRQHSQLESDEAWIGLPKEQYKPRPSRSRSARLNTDTIDLSIPPEEATQMKIKRRRTKEPNVIHSFSPLATSIEAMDEMGFTPNRSREALTKCGGSLEQAIDELLTRSMSDRQPMASAQLFLDKAANSKCLTKDTPLDEVLPSVERNSTTNYSEMQQVQSSNELICEIIRNHRRSQHDQEMDDSEAQTNFVESPDVNLRERPNDLVDETASVSNRRNPSRKRKRKETRLEEDHQPSEEQQNPSSTLTQSHVTSDNGNGSIHAKRVPAEPHIGNTRGRTKLRKIPTPTKDAGEVDDVILKVERCVTSENKNSPSVAKPLDEVDSNPKTSTSDPTSSEDFKGITERDVTPVKSAKIPLDPNESPQNLTEEPKQKSANKSANSHSPILKGKMSYRVGLSRKARITPLLKVMKK